MKLKINDKVRVKRNGSNGSDYFYKVTSDRIWSGYKNGEYIGSCSHAYHGLTEDDFEPYEEVKSIEKRFTMLNALGLINNDLPEVKKDRKTFMNKVTEFVKNLTLSDTEKLLRKYDLHDDCGENTSVANQAIDEKLYNSPESQAYLLEIAQGLEAESKAIK